MVGIGVNLANDKLHQRGYAISFDIDSCPRRTRSLWDLRAIVLTAPGKYCVAEAAQIHSQMEEIVMSVHFDATRALPFLLSPKNLTQN